MWRYEPFLDFAQYLLRMDVVSELIIINNDNTKTPNNPILKHPKVRMLDFGYNIMVNPAWNIGVQAAREDIVCILNDDLRFDLRLLYKIADFMRPDMGAIGLMSGDIDHGQVPVTDGNIDIIPYAGQNCIGFGELMFIHRNTWVDIPAGLNIGMGDIFIFEHALYHRRQNYFIANMFHYHYGNATTREEPSSAAEARIAAEAAVYRKVKGEWLKHTPLPHIYQAIDGWFSEEDASFYKFALDRVEGPAHFVELGSYKGRSSAFMAVEIANSNKDVRFDCIDVWLPNLMYGDLDFRTFKENMAGLVLYHNPVKMEITAASKFYDDNTLDMVFIDADHSYEAVKNDIMHWLPKVKSGGLISGHDIAHEPVRQAVIEAFGSYQTIGNCWYVINA